MKKDDKEGYLKKVKVIFPYDEKMKTHINISSRCIFKYSKNTKCS